MLSPESITTLDGAEGCVPIHNSAKGVVSDSISNPRRRGCRLLYHVLPMDNVVWNFVIKRVERENHS
jgi:hypothetical protein